MNEENKTQDDGYQEIDISKPQKEEPEKDYEVEEEETEQPKVETAKKEEPTEESKKPEELDGINTAGAEKRIRQLIKQRKEKEEQLESQQQQIAELQSQLKNSTQKVQETEKASLVSYENQLKEKLKLAEEGYKSAYDSGDKDKLLEAQKAIADTTTELRMVDAKRFYLDDQAKKTEPQQQTNGEAKTAEQPQQTQAQTQTKAPQQPKLHKLAREWISDNSEWYNKDRISTQAAHVINEDLLQEGFDPETEEFYTEISKRLKKELPNKFGQQEEPTNKPAQVVAGKSRTSASSKGKIRLSQEDLRLAKKMGVPLDVYAREKAKVEKAGDDYTTVNA
tara:strand:+ start:11683 stop:12690 length:1008 start_codon:yes stop_codon:yes gene_type:complete